MSLPTLADRMIDGRTAARGSGNVFLAGLVARDAPQPFCFLVDALKSFLEGGNVVFQTFALVRRRGNGVALTPGPWRRSVRPPPPFDGCGPKKGIVSLVAESAITSDASATDASRQDFSCAVVQATQLQSIRRSPLNTMAIPTIPIAT